MKIKVSLTGKIVIIVIILLYQSFPAIPKISERNLNKYSDIFLSRVIRENPRKEGRIRKYMHSLVRDGRAGLPLINKFGLFLYKIEKQGIRIMNTRFFSGNNTFMLILILSDEKDNQNYAMYVEYEYISKDRSCNLKNLYFSMLFQEKMEEMKVFFRSR